MLRFGLEELQGDRGQRVVGEDQDRRDARQAQGEGDRHARDQAEKQDDKKCCGGHAESPPLPSA